ncbi:2',3'-cyclic-nucleotide 2'-phosphodiesterase (5'-nucleotidase family) [Sulfitobacter undariae]|uniref:2',3'-cyclic-nucleotide 2'-phosphodiesterase (5'-nucleotidase family) n=1 Tax=Sulfitobacter undariae TaxID=1563671 RepID=A0A7W6EBS1_9RHOB|nr:5'-nucleotidase C-terminal domain-containing protein [Sulfitobacter undariae]MBB3995715.1 2',3'-cyclic-nucleotide 2'-phosphodiesterase (5'-nucleotidase family) [Sulfitobacter undariae]
MSSTPFMTPAEHGGLHLSEVAPNPAGHIDRLFLLQGGTTSRIVNADLLPASNAAGRLRIFHFNDLHNHLSDLSGPTAGTHRFAQMVKRVRDARAQGDTVLFLSIGDDHTGTMLDELIGWNTDSFTLDPSYRAYSAAGLDASVLGNHEFDRGSALLAKGIHQDADFPILSANVHGSQHLEIGTDYAPAAIAIVGGLRVGMIGLTTHVETRVGQASDPDLAVAPPVACLNTVLPAIAPLVDVVLIMSHCGYGDGAHKSGKAAEVRDIGEADFSIARAAAQLTDTPVMILGAHTHTRLNEHGLTSDNVFDGVPIFQTECNGKYLGEVDISLNTGTMTLNATRLHPIKPNLQATSSQEAVQQPDDYDVPFQETTIDPILSQVTQALRAELTTVTTNRLSFDDAVLSRYAAESALGNFICDTIHQRLAILGQQADFALLNGATLQAGIEHGPLSAGDLFNVLPYADEVFIVKVTGAQLNDILQSNAQRLLRHDEIGKIDHTGFLARGFFHSSAQLRYCVEQGASAAHARAFAITVCGQPLEDQLHRTFNVIMSTYLALGGFGERWNGKPISGGVPGDLQGYDLRPLPSTHTGLVFRDEIAMQLRNTASLTDQTVPDVDGRLTMTHI